MSSDWLIVCSPLQYSKFAEEEGEIHHLMSLTAFGAASSNRSSSEQDGLNGGVLKDSDCNDFYSRILYDKADCKNINDSLYISYPETSWVTLSQPTAPMMDSQDNTASPASNNNKDDTKAKNSFALSSFH